MDDPLNIGILTGMQIARAWINRPFDAAWDRGIWDTYGYAPATIWFHYGSDDMMPDYHRSKRKGV
jgi:hypothetical protein